MSASIYGKVYVDRANYADGHEVRYRFRICNLSEMPLNFSQNYKTECPMLLTEWIFGMMFVKSLDTGMVSCSVTLKRNDLMKSPVNASICAKFSCIKYGTLYYTKTFERNEMLPSDEMRELIPEIVQFSTMESSMDVDVILYIQKCHSDDYMYAARRVNFDKLLLSKM
ncbi:hypothetical protein HNY73_010504 [Argiope bruennichi]|uniref:Uncharacterized protein n=1 Tax=Argiope bruennichi TaxID=94029 RepID=A0A8T0F364_ARGBR|nr:hypothetical protein HNY73_010504 [Argiope bruennichi]